MSKPYEVLERSFINGRLYEPGEHVTLEIDSPGGNLKLVGAARAAAPINAQTPASEGPIVPPSTESGAPADGNSTGNLPDA